MSVSDRQRQLDRDEVSYERLYGSSPGRAVGRAIGMSLANPLTGWIEGVRWLRQANRRAKALGYFEQEKLRLDRAEQQRKVDAQSALARARGLELMSKANLFENPIPTKAITAFATSTQRGMALRGS